MSHDPDRHVMARSAWHGPKARGYFWSMSTPRAWESARPH